MEVLQFSPGLRAPLHLVAFSHHNRPGLVSRLRVVVVPCIHLRLDVATIVAESKP